MAMRLFRKDKKARKESRATRCFRILLWRLFVKWKVRERVAKANKWADENRGDTMLITVGCLLFSLIIGAFLTLGTDSDKTDNFMTGVEPVEPMFIGMQRIQNAKAYQVNQVEEMARKGQILKHELEQRIQNAKAYQVNQVEEMARKGQILKHELDSLVRMPRKTHDDSLQIVIKYKQLELIVNNLEKGQ